MGSSPVSFLPSPQYQIKFDSLDSSLILYTYGSCQCANVHSQDYILEATVHMCIHLRHICASDRTLKVQILAIPVNCRGENFIQVQFLCL